VLNWLPVFTKKFMQNAQLIVFAGAPAQEQNRWGGDEIGAATQHRPCVLILWHLSLVLIDPVQVSRQQDARSEMAFPDRAA
jgi:hypothetical protein